MGLCARVHGDGKPGLECGFQPESMLMENQASSVSCARVHDDEKPGLECDFVSKSMVTES